MTATWTVAAERMASLSNRVAMAGLGPMPVGSKRWVTASSESVGGRLRSLRCQGSRHSAWSRGRRVVVWFTGFKSATVEELPDAVTVLDPFPRSSLPGGAPKPMSWSANGVAPATRSIRPTNPATGAGLVTDQQQCQILA